MNVQCVRCVHFNPSIIFKRKIKIKRKKKDTEREVQDSKSDTELASADFFFSDSNVTERTVLTFFNVVLCLYASSSYCLARALPSLRPLLCLRVDHTRA